MLNLHLGCMFFATAQFRSANGYEPACQLASLNKHGGAVNKVYALIQTGGKQYKVCEGSIVKVEKLEGETGGNIVLDQVLMINDENGTVQIGSPLLENAQVTAKILEQGKNKKVIVYKYKRRKNYRRKQGHRQPYTRLLIEKIQG